MTKLLANDISVQVRESTLVSNVSTVLRSGELVAVLGPNGAGKTTMLRAMLGLQPISAGSVTLNGALLSDLSAADRARQVSYLPQHRPIAWPNTVRDVVALGRFAHGAAPGKLGRIDVTAVDAAIAACALQSLVERRVDSLSGGERARVHFARVVAAAAPLLVADEPVTELDPLHQLKIADLLRKFVDDGGGAMVVLHEVALAARYADRLIWMQKGRIVADGLPSETMTEQRMLDVYGVHARVSSGSNGAMEVRIEAAGTASEV